jgi:hypothetical protein
LAAQLRDFNSKYHFPTTVLVYSNYRFHRTFDLVSPAEDLDTLALHLEESAEVIKDAGGPTPYLAFRALAKGLAAVFRSATGHSVGITWNNYDNLYEGRFFRLVEDLLPAARKMAQLKTGQPLLEPKTSNARGKYIQRLFES